MIWKELERGREYGQNILSKVLRELIKNECFDQNNLMFKEIDILTLNSIISNEYTCLHGTHKHA